MSAIKNGGCPAKSEGFKCTRKKGHAGRHTAFGIGGILLKSWSTSKKK